MKKIRLLPSHLINQIAAGEVVERPASVVKELVENALDAGASRIEVLIREGGITYLSITDNGSGMSPEDLQLSIERHATSKLPTEDLFHIHTLGFRGEALPSIGAISRLKIQSRSQHLEDGYVLEVEGGQVKNLMPIAMFTGTKVEVKDLFYAIPARLKFLRSALTEQNHIVETLQRLALAYPTVAFTLKTDQKALIQYASHEDNQNGWRRRSADVLGGEFLDNSLAVDMQQEGISLTGFISLPTFNRSNAQQQFFFVNNRPVKDRLLLQTVRVAYMDFLAHDRYPLVNLSLTLPPREVDINVHPAKTEVRFKDIQLIRSLLIGGIKQALSNMSYRASNTVAAETLERFQTHSPLPQQTRQQSSSLRFVAPLIQPKIRQPEHLSAQEPAEIYFTPSIRTEQGQDEIEKLNQYPLGLACAQLHSTYIVSQTESGLVITDQHAAHERIVYEKLKNELKSSGVKSQLLLIPEVVKVSPQEFKALIDAEESFKPLGLVFESFGDNAIVVREIPTLLSRLDLQKLIKDIAEELTHEGTRSTLETRLNAVCSLMSCHGSIRAGQKLVIPEMNTILRQMEETTYSGQCNHGRPTHIVLSLKDVEKLFERK